MPTSRHPAALEHERRVAGGPAESIYQPGWSPDGALYFVSDRDGWWTLYRSRRLEPADVVPVIENPPDRGGIRTAAVATSARRPGRLQVRRALVVAYTQHGRWSLAMVDVASGVLTEPRRRSRASRLADGDADARRGRGRHGDDSRRGRAHRADEPSSRDAAVVIDARAGRRSDLDTARRSSSRPDGGRTAHAFVLPAAKRGVTTAPPGSVRR